MLCYARSPQCFSTILLFTILIIYFYIFQIFFHFQSICVHQTVPHYFLLQLSSLAAILTSNRSNSCAEGLFTRARESIGEFRLIAAGWTTSASSRQSEANGLRGTRLLFLLVCSPLCERSPRRARQGAPGSRRMGADTQLCGDH